MNYNPHTPFSEQDYHLVKTSISKGSNQKEVLRYLTNVLPNSTDVVTLDNAQDIVKSVKAQLANKNLFDETTLLSKDHTEDEEAYIFENNKIGGANLLPNTTFKYKTQYTLQYTAKQENPASSTTMGYPRLEVVYTDGTKSLQQITTEYTTITITSAFDKTVSAIKFEYSNVGKFYLKKDSLSLVEGTVALSPYVPHVSDFSTVNVTRYGKNLFDISNRTKAISNGTDQTLKRKLTGNQYFIGITGNNYWIERNIKEWSIEDYTVTVLNTKNDTTGYGIGFDIKVKPNTTYYITHNNNDNGSVSIGTYTSDGTWKRYLPAASTFTTQADENWIVLVCVQKYTDITINTSTISNIQLEISDEPTSYELYQGQTYTPTASGEVTGITVLSPTTNIINDKGLLFTKVIGDDFNYIN